MWRWNHIVKQVTSSTWVHRHNGYLLHIFSTSTTGMTHWSHQLCITSNKRFTHKSCLTVHSRIHSREKPFECSRCGKRFAHRSCLTAHHVIHSGEKPHNCTQCGKSFTRKFNLTRHLHIHSGDSPMLAVNERTENCWFRSLDWSCSLSRQVTDINKNVVYTVVEMYKEIPSI